MTNELSNFPCNCGHSRIEHTHCSGSSNIGYTATLMYCKRQWDGECSCDTFSPMTNLEYLEMRYDKTTRKV